MTEPNERSSKAKGVELQILAEVARDKLPAGTVRVRGCPLCGSPLRWVVQKAKREGVTVLGACDTPECISFRT